MKSVDGSWRQNRAIAIDRFAGNLMFTVMLQFGQLQVETKEARGGNIRKFGAEMQWFSRLFGKYH